MRFLGRFSQWDFPGVNGREGAEGAEAGDEPGVPRVKDGLLESQGKPGL